MSSIGKGDYAQQTQQADFAQQAQQIDEPTSTATQTADQTEAPAEVTRPTVTITPELGANLSQGLMGLAIGITAAAIFSELLSAISDLLDGPSAGNGVETPDVPGQTGSGSLPPNVVVCNPPNIGGGTPVSAPPPVTTAPPTPPPARDVNAIATKIEQALKTENDDALSRTLDGFFGKTNGANKHELDALVKELSKRGKLDDLAMELGVEGRDHRRRGLTMRHYSLAQLDKAVRAHGSPEARQTWAAARKKLDSIEPTRVNDGRLAGKEVASEIKAGLERKSRSLIEANARDLVRSFPAKKSGLKPGFAAKKLNTSVTTLANDGKLDDFIREMRGSKHGQKLLVKLDKKIDAHGSPDAKRMWDAFEKQKSGKATIPAPPRKEPADRKPAPAKPGKGWEQAAAKPSGPKSGAQQYAKPVTGPKSGAQQAAPSKPASGAHQAAQAKPSGPKSGAHQAAQAKPVTGPKSGAQASVQAKPAPAKSGAQQAVQTKPAAAKPAPANKSGAQQAVQAKPAAPKSGAPQAIQANRKK
jgi:hypothetical protein